MVKKCVKNFWSHLKEKTCLKDEESQKFRDGQISLKTEFFDCQLFLREFLKFFNSSYCINFFTQTCLHSYIISVVILTWVVKPEDLVPPPEDLVPPWKRVIWLQFRSYKLSSVSHGSTVKFGQHLGNICWPTKKFQNFRISFVIPHPPKTRKTSVFVQF